MSKRELPKTPESWDELLAALKELERGVHDPEVAYGPNEDGYGKCVEAMARGAYIAHEYLARILGVTGFQHSMSSLSVVGMLRRIEGPYMLLDLERAVWPQYDLSNTVAEFLTSDSSRSWLADEAEKRLAEVEGRESIDLGDGTMLPPVHPSVKAHWLALVADRPSVEEVKD